MRGAGTWIGVGAVLAVAFAGAARAQAPTTAQRNAIRQSCAVDYRSVCAGVPTGGRPALQCLQQHMSSLSPSCQAAVGAISQGDGGGGGGGGEPLQRSRPMARERPAEACRADYFSFCRGIRPGGGRAMMCLREHAAELSPECQDSLSMLRR